MWRASGDARRLPTGYVSLFGDYFPNRQDTTELRARLFVEEKLEPSPRCRPDAVRLCRGPAVAPCRWAQRARRSRRRVAAGQRGIVRVQDAKFELLGSRVELLAGYARIAWGKLDEIQPTDVINPARRLAILLRGAQRGAVTDAARTSARASRRRASASKALPSGLPARRDSTSSTSPRRRSISRSLSRRTRWRAWRSVVRLRPFRCPIARRRSPPAQRAGRGATLRHQRPGGLERLGVSRFRIVRALHARRARRAHGRQLGA